MTLDELITKPRPCTAWLDEPGFEGLYVRITRRFIDGKWMPSIDLANIKSINPGNGTFTKLVERIKLQYPEFVIYVESVTNPRFDIKLLKMGFVEMKYLPHSYYILPLTIDELINKNCNYVTNVTVPGFDYFYIGIFKRQLENQYFDTINIFNIKATNPGNGSFTRLIERLSKQYPAYAIYVDIVINTRFKSKLLKMGFVEVKDERCNYYILPKE